MHRQLQHKGSGALGGCCGDDNDGDDEEDFEDEGGDGDDYGGGQGSVGKGDRGLRLGRLRVRLGGAANQKNPLAARGAGGPGARSGARSGAHVALASCGEDGFDDGPRAEPCAKLRASSEKEAEAENESCRQQAESSRR